MPKVEKCRAIVEYGSGEFLSEHGAGIDMAVKWCKGTLKRKQVWTDGLFTLHVDVRGVNEFEPGQFLQVGLLRDEKHIHRPYSIASPHGDILEFYIVRVDDGELTPLLWDLEDGAEVEVSQRAAGSFTLKKTPDAEHLWLVGTGTGLAPYVAMLRTQEPWTRYKKVIVVHGVRFDADLSYQEEFANYSGSYGDQFVYIPTLTREDVDGKLKGRIPALLKDGSLESAAGCEISVANSTVMLCGNPAMLDDVEETLGARDMKKHRSKSPGQIVLERYW